MSLITINSIKNCATAIFLSFSIFSQYSLLNKGPFLSQQNFTFLPSTEGRRLLRSANYSTEHASFHGHRTVSATEPFLLPDLKSGTICHRNCDTWTSALNNSGTYWNRISLGFSQPQRIVTFWLLRLRSFLTYLRTYLLTYLLTTNIKNAVVMFAWYYLTV